MILLNIKSPLTVGFYSNDIALDLQAGIGVLVGMGDTPIRTQLDDGSIN
jgi:hypothetical protein